MPWLACFLCGAGSYFRSAVTRSLVLPPPSLGVSSLDLGRPTGRPFFLAVRWGVRPLQSYSAAAGRSLAGPKDS